MSEVKVHAKKLKNKDSASKYYGEILRVGKATIDNAEDNRDENTVAEDVCDAGGYIASGAISRVTARTKYTRYSDKVYGRKELTGDTGSDAAMRKAQREAQRKAAQKSARAAENTGKIGRKITDKADELTSLIAEHVVEFVKDNPVISIIIVLVLLIILAVSGVFTSCSAISNGLQGVVLITSYTADDVDILKVDKDYGILETKLLDEVDEIAAAHAGYDEINYHVDEIGHNPYELAAILTVMYEAYKRDNVQDAIQKILLEQYYITFEEKTEIRERKVKKTRWVDDDSYEEGGYYEEYMDTEKYEYKIVDIYLINHTLKEAVKSLRLSEDQMARYEVLLETYGNRKYLFGDYDIYNIKGNNPGDYDDYHVPGEYLSDEEFANMLKEAEKYLGVSYVWGGYNPDGFDCSGFVSYVINHCGNGWDYGRQTANGLRGITDYVSASDVQPGDLVFFHGTYATNGCSHVGIYVGNGMMIHAGNPVHYSDITTPYWQEHFDSYGRLP